MKLHLKIIEADNIPKMDLFGKADPYVIVTLTDSKDTDRTEYIEETYNPVWNKEMHLRVCSIAESAIFELKDHDKASKDDPIGSYKRIIKKFTPGIVTEEWIQLEEAPRVDKAARIHIVYHLALEGMPPFVNLPYQFLKAIVKIESATEIPKMDAIGETDPYVVLFLQQYPSVKYRTEVIKDCMEPKWNQDFELELLNQTNDILSLQMWDKDLLKDEQISTLDIPLGQFMLYEIAEREYDMKPYKNVKKGGKIKLKFQVVPLGERAWNTGPVPISFPGNASDPQLQKLIQTQVQGLLQAANPPPK